MVIKVQCSRYQGDQETDPSFVPKAFSCTYFYIFQTCFIRSHDQQVKIKFPFVPEQFELFSGEVQPTLVCPRLELLPEAFRMIRIPSDPGTQVIPIIWTK